MPRMIACSRRSLTIATASLVASTVASVAQSQWSVVRLAPEGPSSYSYGVHSGKLVGAAIVDYVERAAIFDAATGNWTDIAPSGSTKSIAWGASGNQQVGYVYFDPEPWRGIFPSRAGLWSGTAASWVSLHPPSRWDSLAFDTDGVQQVGQADGQACLWTGTAASWVNLTPTGTGRANGVHAGRQVGSVVVGSAWHAGTWNGTAYSWVDLHPTGYTDSFGQDIHGSQQVGSVRTSSSEYAALWYGTKTTFVNLNPNGATWSYGYGVDSGMQVGVAFVGGVVRASLWHGSRESWVDLSQVLPPTFASDGAAGHDTWAWDIWFDGVRTYIPGRAYNLVAGRLESIVWVHDSTPPVDTDGDGLNQFEEATHGTDPDVADTDTDGLLDGAEIALSTNPLVPDSDTDGLLDGTEADMAQGGSCPNPNNEDSDGDLLLDGYEVLAGTSPCNPDTDADGVVDPEDPMPTIPGVTTGYLETATRSIADEIAMLAPINLVGPNANATKGRQSVLSSLASDAANAIASGDPMQAATLLGRLMERIDGTSPVPDWLVDSPERAALAADVELAIYLLYLM